MTRPRAQLVISVANPGTGQVASANLVPGALEPVRSPSGRWRLPVGALIVDLAAQAGVAAATLTEPDQPHKPIEPIAYDLSLPADWKPDLPTAYRHELEARVLAARGAGRSWIVLIGDPRPPVRPDPAGHLRRLCDLADQLRVDLVIDARPGATRSGLAWDIHLAHPGAPPPDRGYQLFDDLWAAVAGTTVDQAAIGLDRPDPWTPAHYLAPAYVAGPPTAGGERRPGPLPDLDQLERRLTHDCRTAAGAQAIWRDRHWWHTALRPAHDPAPAASSTHPTAVRRAVEPPAPRHQGDPIPTSPCRRCDATGTGDDERTCPRCRGTRRLLHGAVLTVTDLRGRYLHLNWRPDDPDPPATIVASYGGGPPVLRLPDHYRLTGWANIFGVRPHDLTGLDGAHVIGQHLRDGIIELPDPTADPIRAYLTRVATGLPAGRLIVRANDWPGPGLADLARLALGLDLAIEITAVDHRLDPGDPRRRLGVTWAVNLVDPAAPIGRHPEAHRHSVPEAVAYCLRYLGAVIAAAVPTDPNHPIPIPQHPKPITGHLADLLDTATLTDPVRRLAARHPGRPATARLDATGYRTTVADRDEGRRDNGYDHEWRRH
ncbi:hypothetical protein O7627_19950 [Solwaraspora sp. WMMD1047]|uniref:hypothetical protein n=1 Tax=Solwaraspora sp. WMMD1047 TaxID=3016102 RepID=UPI0024161777|nr:hypothetical protein [Solwaraspora sp. WMMD1047]MDG4831556.1 hypothetical protein [Solwaraspora sp. WMMD1047]